MGASYGLLTMDSQPRDAASVAKSAYEETKKAMCATYTSEKEKNYE